ncbi:MAG: hypothetical protein J6L73_01895 [Muribaculaceae bacterium]|nr:hypothetical protein [Muribaculaceae bacterium]
MEKKKKLIFAQCLLLLAFAGMAMACSGSAEEKKAFEDGWRYGEELGRSMRGCIDEDMIHPNTPADSLDINVIQPGAERADNR